MSARPIVLIAVLLLGVLAGIAWLWSRSSEQSASEFDQSAARPRPSSAPREPERDLELEAMLSELMRLEVETPEPVDELERLEMAESVAPQAAAPIQTAPPAAEAPLLLGDGRVPNSTRVDGLDGPFVSGAWPDGGTMFEATQALDEDGAWRLDGSWRAWYPGGQIEEVGGYVQGFEHGSWSWWYANGALMARGSFDHGMRVGEWAFWHPNGVVIGEGAYEDGRRSGQWTFRGADGRIREDFSGRYEFGSRVGP